MKADGKGWLFTPTGMVDGPLPTHYEPAESPVLNPIYPNRQINPVLKRWERDGNVLAGPADSNYPYVLSTYRLTEHHLSGVMSRWLPWLAELQPELFAEISPELAEAKGIRNTDVVRVITPRGEIRAKALVTQRMQPLQVNGATIHHVGLPWHWGYQGVVTGSVVNDLSAMVGEPNVSIHEGKSFVLQPGEGVMAQTAPGSASPSASPAASPIASPVAMQPTPEPTSTPAATGAAQPANFQGAAPFPAEPMGFFTDTTVCIGCKACEVACKEWNGLPSSNGGANTLSGDSYDNTRRLDGEHWRHVKFIEQFDQAPDGARQGRWLMMSDVCKHCVHAACLEVCPTGAITRTEYDTVVIQADVCNGCRACIAACPFGVIEINPVNKTAMKCTLCYDRMSAGMVPACAQACPTASIQFGPIVELRQRATLRVDQLHAQGESRARLYGADDRIVGGLNSFYLLVDEPEVYGLPSDPQLPSRNLDEGSLLSTLGAAAVAVVGAVSLRKRRMDRFAAEARATSSGLAETEEAERG